jgi:hypothetical protein
MQNKIAECVSIIWKGISPKFLRAMIAPGRASARAAHLLRPERATSVPARVLRGPHLLLLLGPRVLLLRPHKQACAWGRSVAL